MRTTSLATPRRWRSSSAIAYSRPPVGFASLPSQNPAIGSGSVTTVSVSAVAGSKVPDALSPPQPERERCEPGERRRHEPGRTHGGMLFHLRTIAAGTVAGGRMASMSDWDLTRITAATDELLRTTENPRHRAILTNYRRHALLEVSGRYKEILVPEMTIAHPVYRLTEGPQTLVLDGHQAVHDFYAMLSGVGAIVMGPVDEELVVADWGFASECMFHHFMPGRLLMESEDIDDPDATYVVKHVLAFHWPYDDEQRLIGEHVYEDTATRVVEKVDPADVISPARARELLAPQLEREIALV